MKKTRAFISALLLVTVSMSFIACGSSDGGNSDSNTSANSNSSDSDLAVQDKNAYADVDVSEEVRESVNQAALNSDLLEDVELQNKTIKWLSDWDINPDMSGKNKPTELVVFEEKYGGNIEWISCDFGERYEKLANLISGGDSPDFFYGGNMDAFPNGAVKEMFVPVDDYIDFDSELWEDVKDVNDSLLWNGKHYCTIVQSTGDKVACVYNRKTVAEAGLDDPAELYENGEWDWNAFENMLDSFVDVKNQHYGIDGWWFEFALMNTTGIAPVSIEDGKLVSNIGDPAMERVQNWLYSLNQKGSIAIGVGDYGWTAHPEYIGEGKLLFYPVGLYEFYNEKDKWIEKYGEDVFFVPMPKDPEADEYYVPVGMESYLMVKGGKNLEGVAKFLDCKRFAILDEDTKEIADQQFLDDYGWTDEMLEMKDEMQKLADENAFFDLSTGVSKDCGDLLDSNLRNSARGTPWNETYDSIYSTVQIYIDEVNEKSGTE